MSDAATPPTGPPERPIGYWLKLVDRLIDESFDGVFQHSGLTRRHWQVLNTIRDGVSQETSVDGVLSPFTGAAPVAGHGASAVTAEIDDLVRRGWVARDASGGLSVTVAGNHAYHDLLDAVSVSRERVADGISRAEYAQTVATLERMARNLGWDG
ncbi:DNA-binding MarR family transcriptional regulator [Cellulosimicrobium cellulans]|uniref:MarR family winged helix-turn-helix transcriptional regulator n=1 Tax=Cellulosimicrobium cellulans TaxID=1710 RepID=UPI00195DCCA7|nr:MarR family winged helix-turn-helix transcriptional regulator [Cellulosimicrobium cellulans]MBM7821066.1 DNA-binding MarR family transcriptional regulator [Cellulosimicrobium cellulans]